MKKLLWVPAVVMCLVVGSLLGPPGASADQGVRNTTSVQRLAPTCMKKATYRAIKRGMKYRKVKELLNGQKAAFKLTGTDNPYFIYKGCAWTDGDGVLLLYKRSSITDPLGAAKLTDKRLNPCGTVPVCA